jgi:acyl-CoA thioesterase-1
MKHCTLFFSALFLCLSVFWPGSHVPPLFAEDINTKILFLGDSISAGLGVEPDFAYPVLIRDMLKDKGIKGVKITNASISGSTTASALSRLKWFLKAKPDILVLALGANDGLRGLSTKEMAHNLDRVIALATKNGIRVILAGMKIPPNYGPEYSSDFYEVFILLADKYHLSFMPFLLKDVAGKTNLNQADGIHPTREGQKIIADNVLPYILEQL